METTNENALPAGAADLEREELMGALESVLFIAGEPLPKAELTRVFQMNALELNVLLGELESELASAKRGIRLFTTDDTVQLVSAPEYNDWLVRLLAPPQQSPIPFLPLLLQTQ